jgi:hypothetical protein
MSGEAATIGSSRLQRSRSFFIVLVVAGLLQAGTAVAMDRFAALSMIESGDNDHAEGKEKEVSRYQIRRELWLATTNAPLSQATNAAVALGVAQAIAAKRCTEFEAKHGRPPTDFEFYVLWNAPAQIDNPSPAVRSRAERFVNLVRKQE